MKDAAYRITQVSLAVHLPNESPIFGDSATTVRIEDEGAGPFVALHQTQEKEAGTVRLEFSELDAIAEAARILRAGFHSA